MRYAIMGSRLVAVVFGVCMVLGCSEAVRSVDTAPDREPYQFESEGQVPPPDPVSQPRELDRVDVFEESAVSEDSVAVENVIEEVPMVPVEPEDSTVTGSGYRVQVLATGERENAEVVRAEVEARLGGVVYVEPIDGMYKVRVGDCRSRAEAEDLLQRCRAAGYADAWIVSTQIRWRRVVD